MEPRMYLGPSMNQEIKDKWVADLRSGEYKQGHNRLRADVPDGSGGIVSKFCCLGVLCVQAEAAGIVEWLPYDHQCLSSGHGYTTMPGHASSALNGVLPQAVAEWAGLYYTDPPVSYAWRPTSLAELNDRNHSFAEIASIIEEQL
jgi:hypothetical protein